MKIFVGNSKKYLNIDFVYLAFNHLFGYNFCLEDIATNEYGKPLFRNKNMPSFNISHSGEYIVCVFDISDVGIDIQRIRSIPKNIINKYLKCSSNDAVRLVEEWTKFESYGKKMGIGIPFEGDYANGHFLTTFEIDNYVVTVCTDNKNEQTLELIYL